MSRTERPRAEARLRSMRTRNSGLVTSKEERVGQKVNPAQLVDQLDGITIQLLQVRILQHKGKGLAETAANRFRNQRDGQRALDFIDQPGAQAVGTGHHVLDGAGSVIGHGDEHETPRRIARNAVPAR